MNEKAKKLMAADILEAIDRAEQMYSPGTYEYNQVVSAALMARVHQIKWLAKQIAGIRQ